MTVFADGVERRPWQGNPAYFVGADGSIVGPTKGLLRGRGNGKGHLQVTVRKNGAPAKNVRVHQIVCETWHGLAPSPKHGVVHEDGDKSNNRADNLSWMVYKDVRDELRKQHRMGKFIGREHEPISCKLTPDEVREMRVRYGQGETVYSLADEYGVNRRSVQRVITGQSYGWVA